MFTSGSSVILFAAKWAFILLLLLAPIALVCVSIASIVAMLIVGIFGDHMFLMPFIVFGILIYLTRKDKRNEH